MSFRGRIRSQLHHGEQWAFRQMTLKASVTELAAVASLWFLGKPKRQVEQTQRKVCGRKRFEPQLDYEALSKVTEEIPPTRFDTPTQGGMEVDKEEGGRDKRKGDAKSVNSKVSPDPKRPKGVSSPPKLVPLRGGMYGPAPKHTLVDCGGQGNYGYRCAAIIMSCHSLGWNMTSTSFRSIEMRWQVVFVDQWWTTC